MRTCRVCPRMCGIDRSQAAGRCRSDEVMHIARAALHFGEEPPISGERGSGAVFFTGCPLGCIFCQNDEISRRENKGRAVTPAELNRICFGLIEQGAHNINLVTPTHFLLPVRETLLYKPLPVPVVYNSSGYERVESLRALEGLVQVYLPDFKYAEPTLAGALSQAEDYPETALAAIREMVRQVGPPVYDSQGIIQQGVLIRHLILPGHTRNSIAALTLLAKNFPGIPVSLMAQYTPWGQAAAGVPGYPELSRTVTRRELEKVQAVLFDLGLDGFVQTRRAQGSGYIPDFHQFDPV